MLTKRNKQVFNFIIKFKSKHDYSPSLEEIKKHLNLSSVSTAHYHVESLLNMGYLHKEINKPRTVDAFSNQKMVQVPLLGKIAAGTPIEAIYDKENIAIPQDRIRQGSDYFALKVKGTSMIDENIQDGDIVVIKQQDMANNGDTVVALLENNEVTLKKYFKTGNQVKLQPANPDMQPIIIHSNNLAIQGIVIDIIKNISPFQNTDISKDIKSQDKTSSESCLKRWINTIQNMDCVKGMKMLPSNSIDLIITSPPYDGIRLYNGFTYNLHDTGNEVYRILKDGGMAIMVIQDQTKNFGKTLTSFKTIIDWCDNIGFKLFECVIYRKHGAEGAWWKSRFRIDHEYMPIFLKGERPLYFNKEPLKVPSKHGGKVMTGSGSRRTDGKTNPTIKRAINLTKCRGTIWDYSNVSLEDRGTIWEYLMAGDKNPLKRLHPAVFPDQIPIDFISCFCPENGIVLDPFMGSGSSAVAANKLKRNFIGFEISKEYCSIAQKRLQLVQDSLL